MHELRRSERIQKHQYTEQSSAETTPTKKRKLNRQELEANFNSLNEDFVATKLFNDLAFDDGNLNIAELAEDWLNTYEENSLGAQKELINFILNCCGSLITVEEHDISDPSNAGDVVQELELSFKKQGVFEYFLLNSKNNDKKAKLYKNLYKNFLAFFDEIIINADEKFLIAAEIENESDSENDQYQLSVNPLIFELLIWLSKFGSSHISAFRLTSTLGFYQIQTSLTQLIPKRKGKVESLKNLIDKEKAKKDSNRINTVAVANWEKLLQSELGYLNVLSTISQDGLASIFVNRVRDSDPFIRSDSILFLTEWMKILPSEYYQSSFFKYYGWLLRDNDLHVKTYVIRCLAEISDFVLNNKSGKKKNQAKLLVTPFHNFVTENLDYILSFVYYEDDLELKVDTLHFIYSIIDTKWVSFDHIKSLCSLMFANMDKQPSLPSLGSKNKESRLLYAVAKIFYKAEGMDRKSSGKKRISKKSVDSFLKYFYEVFCIHLKITEGDCNYDNVHEQNVDLTIEGISKYDPQIFQAVEFLAPHYKELLHDFALSIIDNTVIDRINISQLTKLWNESEFKLVLFDGYCNSIVSSTKSIGENIKEDISGHLLQIFQHCIKPTLSSNGFSHLVNILTGFTNDDFAEESDSLEIAEVFFDYFFANGLAIYGDVLMKQSLNKMMLHYHNSQSNTKIEDCWQRKYNFLVDKGLQYLKEIDMKNGSFDNDEFDQFIQRFFVVYMNKISICIKTLGADLSSEFFDLFKKLITSNLGTIIEDIKTPNVLNFEIYSSLCFRDVIDINNLLSENEREASNETDWNEVSLKAYNISSVARELIEKVSELQIIDYDSDVIRYVKSDISENLVDILLSYYNEVDNIYHHNSNIQLDGLESFGINENTFGAMREAFIFYESRVLNSDNRDEYEYVKLCAFGLKIKSLLLIMNVQLETSSLWRRLLINKNRLGPEYVSIIG
ncbi:hypothetical protein ACO0R3_003393 [Hanseniaspora guilliermondii]